jgi:pre-rRNA-processing protein IPI3
MAPPQELILSGCSAEATSSSNLGRAYVPSIQIHDLLSNATVHAFKTSTSAPNALAHVGTQNGTGGGIFAVQEGKAIVNVWAWQKVPSTRLFYGRIADNQDQMHLKLHLPEKLSCFAVSPNSAWAAGGSPNGQVYLWEVSSHYKTCAGN